MNLNLCIESQTHLASAKFVLFMPIGGPINKSIIRGSLNGYQHQAECLLALKQAFARLQIGSHLGAVQKSLRLERILNNAYSDICV
jgi:hypothetical protein